MIMNKQSGQTLMETIIAIFILTTALSSGLALMIYAFSSSANSQNEIIASNLAREGVDMVRAMRDSNWLAGDALGGSWDLQLCSDIGTFCYARTSVGPTYNLTPGYYRLQFDGLTWNLDSTSAYDLRIQPQGYYSHTTNSSTSLFARQVRIISNTTSPYTGDNSNWELIVRSIVAWRGKGCADFNTSDNLDVVSTQCKIVVEERLTNWKDYK